MKPKVLKSLAIIILMLAISSFAVAPTLKDDSSKTTSEDMSNAAQLPPNTQDDSKYNHDIKYLRTIVPVYPNKFNFDNVCARTNHNLDDDFVAYIDAEDIFTVSIQCDNYVDGTYSLAVISHNEMKNPFETALKDYNFITQVPFELKDNALKAELMIGYDISISDLVDVLFICDGKIEAYAMFVYTIKNANSPLYWQTMYPDKIVSSFKIICGNKTKEYAFFDENTTIVDWVRQNTNIDSWAFYGTYIVDVKHEWMIPMDDQNVLTEDFVITAEPFDENVFQPYEFDITNPDYLVSMLGRNTDDFIDTFGTPNETIQNNEFIALKYTDFVAIAEGDSGITQIELLSDKYTIVNGLPSNKMTGMEFYQHCLVRGIPYPSAVYHQEPDIPYYKITVDFNYENWGVAYVWESTTQILSATTEFNRIIIYAGKNIIL